MLAARNQDQENLIHAQQTAGAAKSNVLGPKTPGAQQNGKTPVRRGPLNDENTIYRGGKGKGKGKEAFQTPGPRERAPLGAKTTNAKTKPFTTPTAAPLTGVKPQKALQQKTPAQQRVSARKTKLRVHHSPTQVSNDDDPLGVSARPAPTKTEAHSLESDDDSVPEVEYCPPRPIELADYPDPDEPWEFGPHEELPQLKPENVLRGAWQFYHDPMGDDGLTESQREFKQWEERAEKQIEEEERKMTERIRRGESPTFDQYLHNSERTSRGEKHELNNSNHGNKAAGTVASKSAATALNRTTHKQTTSFAAPTASSQARKATTAISTTAAASHRHPRARTTVGDAASRNTIGRAKGRQVSADVRGGKPSMGARTRPQLSTFQAEEAQAEREDRSDKLLEQLMQDFELEQEKKRGVEGVMEDGGLEALEEALRLDMDGVEVFQLDVPGEAILEED